MAAEASLLSCGRADIAAISAIGLALLHRYSLSSKLCEEPLLVPEEMIHEAALFHPFAEAAYTGLLLDVGRNPILFPLSWLCRQGVFSPWARKSRPLLEGDNWWRGHSATFLKYVKLTDDVLRKGCANQLEKQEAKKNSQHQRKWRSKKTGEDSGVTVVEGDGSGRVNGGRKATAVGGRWVSSSREAKPPGALSPPTGRQGVDA
nr:sn1-specific diacylglycerol lipase beta isoform X3 [Ipomoea batatas]